MLKIVSSRHRSPSARVIALWLMTAMLIALSQTRSADAEQPSLTIAGAGEQRQFSSAELLARPDVISLTVKGDIYHGAVPYRAVPLLALLQGLLDTKFDTLEASASDGFASQIPLALIARGGSGGAVAWIAVEDPAQSWPSLPHQAKTAGPFYLIWQDPERSGVTREQWPYQLVHLNLVESPPHRWPQLALPVDLPAAAPARRGQTLFLTDCLPCHRLNGGGASNTGPDLARPMSPTRYLTDQGLRAIIRNPRSVRTWPEQRMIGFNQDLLADADLEAIIAYLHVMAGDADPGAAK
jgi:mono/diheme cytochrome c family protein